MKKLTLSLLMLLATATIALAQNGNIVLFSENGERFYGILNGLRMNEEPVTNLKVQDLNQPGYKLKVIFEDKALGEMNKDIMVAAGEEAVYMIKKDKKGEYKVAWRSSTPIAQAPVYPANTQYVYAWGAPAQVSTNVTTTGGTSTTVVEETVTTTTTSGGVGTNVTTGTGESVSMNVNVDGFGMNVNVNTNDQVVTNNATVTTTTTTTTTTSGGTVGQDVAYVSTPPCNVMDAYGFESALNSVKSKSFEDSKLTVAKQVAKNNCLSVSQVKSIVEQFSFEETKLEFAKYAYPFCYEPNNYYQVGDMFTFESSTEELMQFLDSQR